MCSNKERLLVCLYFMSDLDNNSMTFENIVSNLIKIFPPTINTDFLPEDYVSFQASVIRGQFNRETDNVKRGILPIEHRLWTAVGDGKWRNTDLGNKKAIKVLEDSGIKVSKIGIAVFDS